MEIIIAEDYQEMNQKASYIIAGQILSKPTSVLGLATGSTPIGMYKNLIKLYQDIGLDFSRITTFNLDEYYGISLDNIGSYNYYMYNNFFKHINTTLQENNTFIDAFAIKSLI